MTLCKCGHNEGEHATVSDDMVIAHCCYLDCPCEKWDPIIVPPTAEEEAYWEAEGKKFEPVPIGKCARGLHDVYAVEGFCGFCEPWKR